VGDGYVPGRGLYNIAGLPAQKKVEVSGHHVIGSRLGHRAPVYGSDVGLMGMAGDEGIHLIIGVVDDALQGAFYIRSLIDEGPLGVALMDDDYDSLNPLTLLAQERSGRWHRPHPRT
jgi:hypothetical protein